LTGRTLCPYTTPLEFIVKIRGIHAIPATDDIDFDRKYAVETEKLRGHVDEHGKTALSDSVEGFRGG
jgi:hypothetical protein